MAGSFALGFRFALRIFLSRPRATNTASMAVRDRTTTAARLLNTILPGKVHLFDEVLVTAVTENPLL